MSPHDQAKNIINSIRNNTVSELESHFCESILSEDANDIDNKIRELIESGNYSLKNITELLCQVEGSNFSESTENIFIQKIFESYLQSHNISERIELFEESYILEYSGKEKTNKEYIESLADMERYFHDLNDDLNNIFKLGESIIEIMKDGSSTASNSSDINKIANKIKNKFDEYNRNYANNNGKWKINNNNLDKFKKYNRKFSCKFSTVTLAEKKVIDKKLDQAIAKLYSGDIKKWVKFQEIQNPTPNKEELDKYYYKLKDVDRDSTIELGKLLSSYLNFLVQNWKRTCSFCYYIRKELNLEIEDKLSWKIVHKVFK